MLLQAVVNRASALLGSLRHLELHVVADRQALWQLRLVSEDVLLSSQH